MTNTQRILRDLSKAMSDLDSETVIEYTKKGLEAKIPPQLLIKDGLSTGMEAVGNKFARSEYFLSELIWSGQIMKEAMTILEPHLKAEDKVTAGKIVIATVQGDLHDIGKNIAISMLQSANYDVIDLGVDVPPETIIEKAKETEADIIALTALISHVVPYMELTVKTIRESSIGNRVKILIGGRVYNEEKAKNIGADAYAQDAWDGISKANELMSLISNS